jgi:hypothetical protein
MNFNGTRPSHRNRFYLLSEGKLSSSEFLLFELLIDQIAFDPDKDMFGKYKLDKENFSKYLGYKAKLPFNSISNLHNSLLSKGLVIPTENKEEFEIYNFQRYISETKSDKWKGRSETFRKQEMNLDPLGVLQNIVSKPQNIVESSQNSVKKNLDLLKKTSSRYLSSSKVESNGFSNKDLVKNVTDEKRTLSYYETLYRENDIYTTLTVVDMQWLDDRITAEGKII